MIARILALWPSRALDRAAERYTRHAPYWTRADAVSYCLRSYARSPRDVDSYVVDGCIIAAVIAAIASAL